jgi:signal transduction histidine kinase
MKLMDSARQSALNTSSHNINDILDEAISLAMDRVRLRRVKIKKEYEQEMCDIQVDGEKVKTALLNIIINAIEAVDQDGTVLIKSEVSEEECIVTISDNGMGMEKDKLGQLFDPFFTGKKRGLGLGLTSTLNILNSHDANIEVASELGKGTTLVVFFKK